MRRHGGNEVQKKPSGLSIPVTASSSDVLGYRAQVED